MTQPSSVTTLPEGASLLAATERCLGSCSWQTTLWLSSDGSYGALVTEDAPDGARIRARVEGAASLAEVDRSLVDALRWSGARGDHRIGLLSSAASAFEEACLRAA